jgi:hypothetical protein
MVRFCRSSLQTFGGCELDVPSVADVKKGIREVLLADPSVVGLVDDRVFLEWALRKAVFPCLSIVEVTDQTEASGLKDSFDGSKRYQWHHAVIQVDCWSQKSAEERDQLANTVEKCLLKNPVEGAIYVQEPAITALDELDVKPALWRKSLRYKVMCIMEA